MTRVKRKNIKQQKHKKILRLTRSYNGHHSKLFSQAKQQLFKSLRSSFVNRKQWKQKTRRLWIKVINQMLKKFELFFKKTYLTKNLPWFIVTQAGSETSNDKSTLQLRPETCEQIEFFKYNFEIFEHHLKENKIQACANYSQFIFCLKNESICLNRKILAHLFIFNQKIMFNFVKNIGKLTKQRQKINKINSYSNIFYNYYWCPIQLIDASYPKSNGVRSTQILLEAPMWQENIFESYKNSKYYFAYSKTKNKWYLIDLHLLNRVSFNYKIEGKNIKWLNQTNSKFNSRLINEKKIETKYNKILETYANV